MRISDWSSDVCSSDLLAPLLYPHTVYKSYPISYLERARFDKLTKWLGGLTTVDISNVDASGIESIDDWLDLIDAETPLTVAHTSGTTGKLSFVPRTKEQWTQTNTHSAIIIRSEERRGGKAGVRTCNSEA